MITILFILVFTSFILILLNRVGASLSSYYLNYSKSKAKEIIDVSLNNAIDEDVLKEFKNTDIYTLKLNSEGDIQTIDYNSLVVNMLLKKISTNLYNNLKTEEKNSKPSFYIPFMAFSHNPLLANKGPRIPVRIEPVGYVISEVKTNVKPCGLNSSLIEMSIHVKLVERIILPISSKEIKIENNLPLFYKIINGKVPTYYGGAYSTNSSSFSLPME